LPILIDDEDLKKSKYSLEDRSVRRYLAKLGFVSRKVSKGVFEDGHERWDVVKHRKEFLREIALFNFSTFGDDTGYGVLASAREEKVYARVFIKAGRNRDGYWTNEDLIKQFKEKALRGFNHLHPGSVAVFIFDNSQNHHAMAPDALRVSRMTLSGGGKNVTVMRNGFFVKSGIKFTQSMMVNGKNRGIRSTLEARGLWTKGLRGKCVRAEDHRDDNSCCATKLLGSQPDFLNQQEWIIEEVEKSGHILFFLL
jgi:hypothetical protein